MTRGLSTRSDSPGDLKSSVTVTTRHYIRLSSRAACVRDTMRLVRSLSPSLQLSLLMIAKHIFALLAIDYIGIAHASNPHGVAYARTATTQPRESPIVHKRGDDPLPPYWTLPAVDRYIDSRTSFVPPGQSQMCPRGTINCGTFCNGAHHIPRHGHYQGRAYFISCCRDTMLPFAQQRERTRKPFKCPQTHVCVPEGGPDRTLGRWDPHSALPRPRIICVAKRVISMYAPIVRESSRHRSNRQSRASTSQVAATTSSHISSATEAAQPVQLTYVDHESTPARVGDVSAAGPSDLNFEFRPLLNDADWEVFLTEFNIADGLLTATNDRDDHALTIDDASTPMIAVEPNSIPTLGVAVQRDPAWVATTTLDAHMPVVSGLRRPEEARCPYGYVFRGRYCNYVHPSKSRKYYLLCLDQTLEPDRWFDAPQRPQGFCPRGTLCVPIGHSRPPRAFYQLIDEIANICCMLSAEYRFRLRRRPARAPALDNPALQPTAVGSEGPDTQSPTRASGLVPIDLYAQVVLAHQQRAQQEPSHAPPDTAEIGSGAGDGSHDGMMSTQPTQLVESLYMSIPRHPQH